MTLLDEVREHAFELAPPMSVLGSMTTGSFDDAIVKIEDEGAFWWVVRERGVLFLSASPRDDADDLYDLALISRHLQLPGVPASSPEQSASVKDLMAALQRFRRPVAAMFGSAAWASTRKNLLMLGRRMDFERFGRPMPESK